MSTSAFGRKLARLASDAEMRTPSVARGSAVEGSEPTTPSVFETLSQLRRQMATIVGKPAGNSAAAQPVKGIDHLPFNLIESQQGRVWQRISRVPLSYQVGTRPCSSGTDADFRRLALLGLDPALADFGAKDALFLDTETTGFGGAGTLAFLVGLAYVSEGSLWLEQLILEGPEHELAMLEHLQERLHSKRVLVSFNGKSFDWPLLTARYVMNRLTPPTVHHHLDLLHVARRVHKQRLNRCSLQSVEAMVLGFERHDDVGGAEVAARYIHYCRTGDASGLEGVVEHNYWDVLSMVALVGVYGEPEFDLPATDVASAARTMVRARALPQALVLAERAVDAGGGFRALIVRAEIRKALGDRQGALADFQQASESPVARLHLAKLYEHFLKDAARALQMVELGTSEAEPAALKRRERLLRKSLRKPT